MNIVEHVKNHGYNAFYIREEIFGEPWFRVYVGTFEHKEDAEKEGASLKEARVITDFKVTKLGQAQVLSGAASGSDP